MCLFCTSYESEPWLGNSLRLYYIVRLDCIAMHLGDVWVGAGSRAHWRCATPCLGGVWPCAGGGGQGCHGGGAGAGQQRAAVSDAFQAGRHGGPGGGKGPWVSAWEPLSSNQHSPLVRSRSLCFRPAFTPACRAVTCHAVAVCCVPWCAPWQLSCLRTEQAQLSRTLEKERQRAAENRAEYLAAQEASAAADMRVKQVRPGRADAHVLAPATHAPNERPCSHGWLQGYGPIDPCRSRSTGRGKARVQNIVLYACRVLRTCMRKKGGYSTWC